MNYALKIQKLNRLKWACRGVVAAATGISVWSNSLIASGDTRSLIISIMPPCLTLIGFELVSRIPLHGSFILRLVRPVATAGVTLIGGWLSYFHQKEAFARYTTDKSTAQLLPVAIDGLMVIAAVSLMELNAGIEHLETRQAGLDVRINTRAPIKATNVRPVTGKERVALILQRTPDISTKELAAKAEVSLAYAGNLASELRRSRTQIEDAVEV